jgi:hypothetical protein
LAQPAATINPGAEIFILAQVILPQLIHWVNNKHVCWFLLTIEKPQSTIEQAFWAVSHRTNRRTSRHQIGPEK